jgi:hypothetical protein
MKRVNQFKQLSPTPKAFGRSGIHMTLLLAWLALSPIAQAVVPPPDGGYLGFNTAEGEKALFGLTTGVGNTAVGWFSLFSNTDGSFNTGVGAGTLLFNVGDQSTGDGVNNTALGTVALLFNTTGSQNTAVGTQALFSSTEGDANTATGYQALANNTEGDINTANGSQALVNNTTGTGNTATGVGALQNNTTGLANVAIGVTALRDNVSGSFNVAVGRSAGVALTGDGNICIGNAVFGVAGESSTTRIRNIYSSVASERAVFVNSDNKLGTLFSTRRVKDDIKPMDRTSEAILALKPVTFRYKKEVERSRAIQFGLIAEEVAEVSPDLVILDAAGKPESVRYEAINAMLLNEFLRQHIKVEEQGRKIKEQETAIAQQRADFATATAQQHKQIEALTASVKEQATQIQRLSAQIELNKPATQQVAFKTP